MLSHFISYIKAKTNFKADHTRESSSMHWLKIITIYYVSVQLQAFLKILFNLLLCFCPEPLPIPVYPLIFILVESLKLNIAAQVFCF